MHQGGSASIERGILTAVCVTHCVCVCDTRCVCVLCVCAYRVGRAATAEAPPAGHARSCRRSVAALRPLHASAARCCCCWRRCCWLSPVVGGGAGAVAGWRWRSRRCRPAGRRGLLRQTHAARPSAFNRLQHSCPSPGPGRVPLQLSPASRPDRRWLAVHAGSRRFPDSGSSPSGRLQVHPRLVAQHGCRRAGRCGARFRLHRRSAVRLWTASGLRIDALPL